VRKSAPPLFLGRRSYPGTSGGPFEILVTFGERFERVPWWLFGGVLVASWSLADAAFGRGALCLVGFSLLDWAILGLLPRLNRSFGPPKFATLILFLMRWPFAGLPGIWSWVAQCLGSGLVVYSFAVEPLWLQATHHVFSSEKLNGMRPVRVLHLGDLHLERTTRREAEVVAMARALAPDMILFSGDFLSYSTVHDDVARKQVREFFSELKAPLGTYVVSGSPPVDPEPVLEQMLQGLELEWLRDSVIRIHRDGIDLQIIGMTCTHQPAVDGARLETLVEGTASRFSILLYHSPDLAPLAAPRGIDLQLSGHTHGGQVRVPLFGALYTSSLYGKQYEAGEYTIGRMRLFVTRGIGLEGRGAPRVRFWCRPEIAVWDLGPEL